VVADGMTGFRHRPNQELVGQGIANVGSALFGGLPATGAIARTATNIKAGGRTPVAGMLHALFLAIAVVAARDWLGLVPMAALAAILFVVAWGMSEIERFVLFMRMPAGDRAILLLTFLLTVLVDLTVAIAVGVTLASLLFAARMRSNVSIEAGAAQPDESEDLHQRDALPEGVEVFRLSGPLFFGVSGELLDTMRRIGRRPRAIILRMRLVPYLDASAATALAELAHQAAAMGCRLILSGVQPQPAEVLRRAGLGPAGDGSPGNGAAGHAPAYAADYAAALALARES
jgi:SulP family sulfate permease